MRYRRITISLLVLLMILPVSALPPVMAGGNEVVVRTEEELLAAIDSQAAVVVIDGLIPLSQEIVIDHYLTLRGHGTLTVSDWHRHFRITWDGHLVLDGDIILTRAADYDGYGGGVDVWRGVFTLHSGQIYGNRQNRGGGILLDFGQVYLYGGAIRQNHAELGGGVYIGSTWTLWHSDRVLTMRGGVIAENTAEFSGGGIYSYMSTLHLERGTVRDNRAAGHGGVYISATTIHQIGPGMRIEENSPRNRHDLPEISWFERLQTLSVFHILVLSAIAVIGIFVAKWRNNRKSLKNTIRESYLF